MQGLCKESASDCSCTFLVFSLHFPLEWRTMQGICKQILHFPYICPLARILCKDCARNMQAIVLTLSLHIPSIFHHYNKMQGIYGEYVSKSSCTFLTCSLHVGQTGSLKIENARIYKFVKVVKVMLLNYMYIICSTIVWHCTSIIVVTL